MDSNLEATCREWARSHYWQLQERHGWRYAFHESVMVRYYEEANLDASLLEPLVEFLKGNGWQDSFTVHNKPMDMSGWKTRDVWYETRDGDTKETTKLKRTRIYHAVYKEGTRGADGPYTVENGCKWKVTHKFYWRVASLPEVPQGESGVQYRLQGVARDDETGLWSCVLEKRETVQQDVAEYGTQRTMFEHRTEEQHLGVKQGQVASTGKQASAGGGTMVRRTVRKNEDCTSDVTIDTIEEQARPGAVTETTKLMRGTRETTVNRNQATKAEIGAADVSVRNEMTDGGLWNQTITRFVMAVGWIRKMCRKTVFLHEHAETAVSPNDPGFKHVVEAGGGIVHEKTVTRNDEGGFDVETRTREEQNVPEAVVETRKFIDGVQVTTVNRGQSANASAAGLRIGEAVRNEKTEGGCIDQTIVQASVEPVGLTGEACERGALQHMHSRTEGMGAQPQQAEVEQQDGEIRTRRVRLTERGAYEVTDETRTARPKQADATGGSAKRQLEVTAYRNADDVNPGPGGVNEEVEVSVQRNEFGKVDGTVRRTTHSPTCGTAQGGTFLTRETRTVEDFKESGEANDEPNRGTAYDNAVVENELGSFRVTKTTRTAMSDHQSLPYADVVETDKQVTTYRCMVDVWRNQESMPSPPDDYNNISASLQINEFGLFDVVFHCKKWLKTEDKEKSGAGGEGEGGSDSGNTMTVTKMYQKKDGKMYKRDWTVSYDMCWGGSPAWLAKQMKNCKNFPELGCVTGMRGKIMYIYKTATPGAETEIGGSSGS